jgi:hypothetical protein
MIDHNDVEEFVVGIVDVVTKRVPLTEPEVDRLCKMMTGCLNDFFLLK